jgi:hypothetical protein
MTTATRNPAFWTLKEELDRLTRGQELLAHEIVGAAQTVVRTQPITEPARGILDALLDKYAYLEAERQQKVASMWEVRS